MLAKNTHDKYRKNRRNNKCNKIPDLESKEAKKIDPGQKWKFQTGIFVEWKAPKVTNGQKSLTV